ncbi:phospholipase D [Pseudomonas saudimassiliensis]|uniref:Phospholipase D n=1 Tax=Pseudomonas saudimassiliensis TaxID=1461581 RepID=A0A078MIH4_9PSED|nr:phosphatidylserine/phosphatidylglycerophosphate/cardiolipin synthase family protein [Pseudomonas saudimassiliensis]CEA06095.1 phospholipase D [Pseudomonas saudimassiliensis]CEF27520.1 phospholipase D [Pseudomonas saudimassiliensis]
MVKPIYPWREGNTFELLMDGHRFFPRMLQAMEQARNSIDIQLYLVESGRSLQQVTDILLRAVARGVQVRCRFDSLGSRELTDADRDLLTRGGVELRFYNPLNLWGGRSNLHRDHRKLVIIDQRNVFIGGTGFTDDFCIPGPEGHCLWHEQMLEVQGPVVADWVEVFEQQWQATERRSGRPPGRLRRVRLPPHPPTADGLARVSLTDGLTHRELVQALLANIGRARQQVWLATPYFAPTRRIHRALMEAARRGVDVRLLLCGEITDHPAVRYAGQRYYKRLLAAGVRIFEYQPRFLHLKTVLVDDWVSLGSSNFDHWTLHWNLEANQNIIDRGMTRAVEESFVADFAESREWTLDDWLALPWYHRLKISLWGVVNRAVVSGLDVRR